MSTPSSHLSVPVAAHSIAAPAATTQPVLHSLYRRVPHHGEKRSMSA
ncbi:hypothetical protein [Streptomyces sp. NPDC058667]